ncbi:MAG: queuosine precursor transporter [Granulosicoccaceae bacterium]
MNRGFILGVVAMAAVVVTSNVLVQFLLGDWLTWGAFTYPLAFLVTDITNRLYGAVQARKVVLVGFIVGLVCSFVGTQLSGEFGPLVTWRIALGSGTAFLVAQMLDVSVFDRLRSGTWWRAPLVSSLLGSSIDTALFFSVAFAAQLAFIEPANDVSWANEALPLLGLGPVVPLWVSLAVADWCVKVALMLVALGPYRQLSKNFTSQPA